ncbi:unnamed protein product, partial [Mesorhabditis belari]|uniref:phospholipase A2 n=1 Tax=Mesorhabditis belari TaxID=2138241 RepID=A0AAF3EQ07_9BILA
MYRWLFKRKYDDASRNNDEVNGSLSHEGSKEKLDNNGRIHSIDDMMKLEENGGASSETESETSDVATFSDGGTGLWTQFGQMFWTQPSTRKSSFITGLDSWVPEDCEKVLAFPCNTINKYTKVYPIYSNSTKDSSFSVLVDATPLAKSKQKAAVNHLVLTIHPNAGPNKNREFSLSLYRSRKVTDVVALCERCRECRKLFRYFPRGKENTIESLSQLCCPEGLTPLMIAIQQNDEEMVTLLVSLGVDLMQTTVEANNVLHLAACTTPSILNILWNALEPEQKRILLNHLNHDGASPQYVAFSSMNARCLSSLVSYSKQIDPHAEPENPLISAMKSSKTTIVQLEAILKQNPDALEKKDALTGNSVLHAVAHKRPLSALIEVMGSKLDVNVRNNQQQTPLHVYVHKNHLSLVFTILGAEVDINAPDEDGNTPMHVAVSNLNLQIVRTLLCFGANPNMKNRYDETPRHLAAKNKDEPGAIDILRSLIMFGAKSCPIDKLGCTVACVHKINYISEKMSPTGSNAALQDSSAEVEKDVENAKVRADAATGAYEFEIDPDTHDINYAYVEPNPARKFPQEEAMRHVKQMLEKIVKEKEKSNIISILSCDGGGMKGIVMVQILIILQRYLDSPVQTYFDWMAATSTGTYVAGALAKGLSLPHMQRYYLRTKDILFTTWTRPYNTLRFEQLCKEALGDDRMLDISYPKLIFTTTRADTFPCQLTLQRNYQLPMTMKENLDLGFDDPAEIPLWLAARRSAAAPTYFAASEGKFIDGGMVANNPSLDLLSEVMFWNTSCQMKSESSKTEKEKRDDPKDVTIGCLLSLGTGITPVSPVDPSLFEMSDTLGMLRGIKNLTLMVLDQATATEGAPISRCRSWCHSLRIPYFRLNAPLFKDVMLDASDDVEIAQVLWDCEVYGYTHRKDFVELAELLKAIGTNKHRKTRLGTGLSTDYDEIRLSRKASKESSIRRFLRYPANLYNCSGKTRDEWLRTGEKWPIAGPVFMGMGAVFLLLYLPSIYAILKLKLTRNICYKLMLCLIFTDIANLMANSFVGGYLFQIGAVFCWNPVFMYLEGVYNSLIWGIAAFLYVVLAVNRFLVILGRPRLVRGFSRIRIWVWLFLAVIWGLLISILTKPLSYNSKAMIAIVFPFIEDMNKENLLYVNKAHTFNNLLFANLIFSIYSAIIFILLYTRSKGGIKISRGEMNVRFWKLLVTQPF